MAATKTNPAGSVGASDGWETSTSTFWSTGPSLNDESFKVIKPSNTGWGIFWRSDTNWAQLDDSAAPTLLSEPVSTESDERRARRPLDKAAWLHRCKSDFLAIVESETMEYGFVNPSQQLIEHYYDTYGANFGELIQHIFHSELTNPGVCIALLKGLSSLPYSELVPHGPVLMLAAIAHENDEVKEAAIRAFERWEHADGIRVLKSARTNWPWLEEYRLATIQYLEALHGISNP